MVIWEGGGLARKSAGCSETCSGMVGRFEAGKELIRIY